MKNQQSLIPISCLDDLALGLLSQAKYKYEVMKGQAARVLGVDFWANEAEAKELRKKTRAFEVEADRVQTQLARLEVHVRTVAQKE
jgi:hypothetical protein